MDYELKINRTFDGMCSGVSVISDTWICSKLRSNINSHAERYCKASLENFFYVAQSPDWLLRRKSHLHATSGALHKDKNCTYQGERAVSMSSANKNAWCLTWHCHREQRFSLIRIARNFSRCSLIRSLYGYASLRSSHKDNDEWTLKQANCSQPRPSRRKFQLGPRSHVLDLFVRRWPARHDNNRRQKRIQSCDNNEQQWATNLLSTESSRSNLFRFLVIWRGLRLVVCARALCLCNLTSGHLTTQGDIGGHVSKKDLRLCAAPIASRERNFRRLLQFVSAHLARTFFLFRVSPTQVAPTIYRPLVYFNKLIRRIFFFDFGTDQGGHSTMMINNIHRPCDGNYDAQLADGCVWSTIARPTS